MNMYLTMNCTIKGKLVIFIIKALFLVTASITSGFIAKKLWNASNFGYLRMYRKRIVSDEIMIQTIILSNILILVYPCVAFTMQVKEWVLIIVFTCIEIIPLSFILYMLFKELGTIDKIASYFMQINKKNSADTGATAVRHSNHGSDNSFELDFFDSDDFDRSQVIDSVGRQSELLLADRGVDRTTKDGKIFNSDEL